MCKVLVFAGTIEGRSIARFLADQGIPVHACVATEYGEEVIKEDQEASENLTVTCGRLEPEQMQALMEHMGEGLVIDATHPYAVVVSQNIQLACKAAGKEYLRLYRASDAITGNYIAVDSVEEAVEYLKTTQGNVLLTTGSKELSKYTQVPDFGQRLYPRILPTAEVIGDCLQMGYAAKNLICMQGPFDEDLNVALLKQIHASYLVTKESGKAGGFAQKVSAAHKAGAELIVIGRPVQENGLSLEEMKAELRTRLNLPEESVEEEVKPKRQVTIIGIGMGSAENMTVEAVRACEEADAILGASRMLEVCAHLNKPCFAGYKYDQLKDYIDAHPEYQKMVLLMSGDIGFYSGAKKMIDCLKNDYEVKTLAGISSVVYFCGKLQLSWDDIHLMSLHGKTGNLVAAVANHKKVFSLIGGKDAVGQLCSQLTEYGLGDVQVHTGTNLSYPDEEILHGTAKELAGQPIGGLCVIVVENPQAGQMPVTHGIEDEQFIRGKVPMTKSEIRSISLSKLQLHFDSVLYDVGAGTGSISIEAALQSPDGYVYAIEKNETACALIEENKHKFRTANIEVVSGLAPEALEDLPVPTHAFIGGSSGNMKEILETLLQKNPHIRVVINTIALESIAETLDCIQKLPVKDVDIASVNIAKSRTLGRYHMMTGLNPIYVVAFTGDA
jgi:precorrin-6Y C5,15-methyltransferase (decarboxylating)